MFANDLGGNLKKLTNVQEYRILTLTRYVDVALCRPPPEHLKQAKYNY